MPERARRRSIAIAGAAFVVFCLTLITLSIAALIGQSAAQEDAQKANEVAQAAVDSNNALREIIVARCNQRTAYDARFVAATKDDIATYQTSIAVAEANLSNPIFAGNPSLKKAQMQSIQILKSAVARKQKIVEQGVIGNCSVYTNPPPAP